MEETGIPPPPPPRWPTVKLIGSGCCAPQRSERGHLQQSEVMVVVVVGGKERTGCHIHAEVLHMLNPPECFLRPLGDWQGPMDGKKKKLNKVF